MQTRPEKLGWEEKQAQRQAVLRSLTAVNLQISTLTEHIFCLEEQIRHMHSSASVERSRPATPLSN